jgi:hypothetical protein
VEIVFLGMQLREPYRDIRHTMRMFGRQVKDSLAYARNFIPANADPKEIWYILKQHLTYKNDPPGVELLQSFPTMMENNYWGTPGAGDCDCFTIAAVSCAVVNHIPVRIVIVGNHKDGPSHVYCEMKYKGRWDVFDLVNPFYGETKAYRHRQVIDVK